MERSTGIALSKTSSEPLYRQLFDQIVARILAGRFPAGFPPSADARSRPSSDQPQHRRARLRRSRSGGLRRLDGGARHVRRARCRCAGRPWRPRRKGACPGRRSCRAQAKVESLRRAQRFQSRPCGSRRRSTSRACSRRPISCPTPRPPLLRPRASQTGRRARSATRRPKGLPAARAHRRRSRAARRSRARRRRPHHDRQPAGARSHRAHAHRSGRHLPRRRRDVLGRHRRLLARRRASRSRALRRRRSGHGGARAAHARRRQGALPHAQLQQPDGRRDLGGAAQEPRRVVAARGRAAHRGRLRLRSVARRAAARLPRCDRSAATSSTWAPSARSSCPRCASASSCARARSGPRSLDVKQAIDLGTSLLLQHVLAEFLERGYLRAHLGRTLPEYRARRDALEQSLAQASAAGHDMAAARARARALAAASGRARLRSGVRRGAAPRRARRAERALRGRSAPRARAAPHVLRGAARPPRARRKAPRRSAARARQTAAPPDAQRASSCKRV